MIILKPFLFILLHYVVYGQNSYDAFTHTETTKSDRIVQVFNNITKSPSDQDRSYRGLILSNGLRIMLISEPKTNFSAAAMAVNAGDRNNPKEFLGMAHFVEHMLFQGSSKYPDKSIFWNFIDKFGGTKNAGTSEDRTTYIFSIASSHFGEALDMWAHFFISSLFNESEVLKEVEAVQSEFSRNVNNDAWRVIQVFSSFCDYDDGYSPFTIGNTETLADAATKLNVSLALEAKKFFEKYYSSNTMSLSILSPQSLDDMTLLIVPIFSQIKNLNITRLRIWKSPFGRHFLGKLVKITSILNTKRMEVNFPITIDMITYSHKLAVDFVNHFFNNRMNGSFIYRLKSEQLITEAVVQYTNIARGSGLYSCTFLLTDKGFNQTDQILDMLFAYLKIIKTKTDWEWINDETKVIGNNAFILLAKHNEYQTVATVADRIADNYSLSDVWTHDYIYNEPFDQNFIEKFLSMFSVDNFNYALISNVYKGQLNRKEKYMGVEYSVDEIPKFLLNILQTADGGKFNFTLPKPNSYIPRDIHVQRQSNTNPVPPTIILDDKMRRLWYSKDVVFNKPLTKMFFLLTFPTGGCGAKRQMLLKLYTSLIQLILIQELQDAALAGYTFLIKAVNSGLKLEISGYTEKIAQLAVKVFRLILTAKIETSKFNDLRALTIDSLKSVESANSDVLANYYHSVLLSANSVIYTEKLTEISSISFKDLVSYRADMFDKLHIQCFIYGHMEKESAMELFLNLSSLVLNTTKSKPIFSSEVNYDRAVKIGEGQSFVYKKKLALQVQTANLAIFETRTRSIKDMVMNDLLGQVLAGPCFSALRSEEQLGKMCYFAGCGAASSIMVNKFLFAVSGPYDPQYIDSRIEAFIGNVKDMISSISSTSFQLTKNALRDNYLKKFDTMYQQADWFFNEIASLEYFFDRRQVVAKALDNVTKDDMIEYAMNLLDQKSQTRSKLGIQLSISSQMLNGNESNLNSPEEINPRIVTDFVEFKRYAALYPLANPMMNVSKIGV